MTRPRIYTGTCKREGCERAPYARGMCNSHYEVWRRSFGVKLARPDTRKAILKLLPGTRAEVAAKIELSKDRTVRILRELRAAGKIYIHHFVPPVGRGGPWKAVYARGNQPDAALDPEVVKARALEQRRIQHAERVLKSNPTAGCTNDALLYANIFNLSKRKDQKCPTKSRY